MNDRFKCAKCVSRRVAYVSYANDYILCHHGTKIKQSNCKKCHKSLSYFAGCGQKINSYKDSKSTHRHKENVTS